MRVCVRTHGRSEGTGSPRRPGPTILPEVDEGARHCWLGRELARAARHLVPDGQPVRSQQATGDARSVRAFQAAGYRPVGAEALMPAPHR